MQKRINFIALMAKKNRHNLLLACKKDEIFNCLSIASMKKYNFNSA